MGNTIKADLVKTLAALSSACDLSDLHVLNHSERVAYLSYRLGQQLGLVQESLKKLILSALLHDIGVGTSKEKALLTEHDVNPTLSRAHCERGHELLKDSKLFQPLSGIILHHHDHYQEDVPTESAIIHLADRVEILLDRSKYALWQVEDISQFILDRRGTMFSPSVVDAFLKIAKTPYTWLDLESGHYRDFLGDCSSCHQELTIDQLEEIALLFSRIVDGKSPYTAEHSFGVAGVAVFIFEQMGMPPESLRLMRTAGLLHDLGKLAVPDSILLFPGRLDDEQMAVMKQHTYYTYHLIGSIGQGVGDVQRWAAYHHEKLDGSGYPFGLKAKDLDVGTRVMAVADITQALTENRPYRPAMDKSIVLRILGNEVANNHLDKDIVQIVLDNYSSIASGQHAIA